MAPARHTSSRLLLTAPLRSTSSSPPLRMRKLRLGAPKALVQGHSVRGQGPDRAHLSPWPTQWPQSSPWKPPFVTGPTPRFWPLPLPWEPRPGVPRSRGRPLSHLLCKANQGRVREGARRQQGRLEAQRAPGGTQVGVGAQVSKSMESVWTCGGLEELDRSSGEGGAGAQVGLGFTEATGRWPRTWRNFVSARLGPRVSAEPQGRQSRVLLSVTGQLRPSLCVSPPRSRCPPCCSSS